jgi:hypothetical protein
LAITPESADVVLARLVRLANLKLDMQIALQRDHANSEEPYEQMIATERLYATLRQRIEGSPSHTAAAVGQ